MMAKAWLPFRRVDPPKRGDIHIWRAGTTPLARPLEEFNKVLSPDERERAQKLIFPKNREVFILARGLLRIILAGYLGTEPAWIRFSYGPNGKPSLAIPYSLTNSVRFSVSHTQGMVLFAFTTDCEVGVDVECIEPDFPIEEIAPHFLTSREIAVLYALPAPQRTSAFFSMWTRKEAFLKATGEGLAHPLETINLWQLLNDDKPGAWSIEDILLEPGYAAAVAVQGNSSCNVTCWERAD